MLAKFQKMMLCRNTIRTKTFYPINSLTYQKMTSAAAIAHPIKIIPHFFFHFRIGLTAVSDASNTVA